MIDKALELIFTARLDKNYEEKLRRDVEKLKQDLGRPVDIKVGFDELGRVNQLVLKTTNELNQQVISTYKLDAATGKVAKLHGVVVDSLEKQNMLVDSYKIKQQSLLNQVDKFTKLNKEFIDKGSLSQEYAELEQSIRKIDPANKNFTNQIAAQKVKFQELGTQVAVVKKEIQESTRFTSIFGEQIVEAGRIFCPFAVNL